MMRQVILTRNCVVSFDKNGKGSRGDVRVHCFRLSRIRSAGPTNTLTCKETNKGVHGGCVWLDGKFGSDLEP